MDSYTSGERATWVRPLSRGESAAAILLVILPATVGLGLWAIGRDVHPVALFVATALMLGLAAVRLTAAWRDNQASAADLASAARFASALSRHASDAVAVIDGDGVIKRRGSNLPALMGFGDVDGFGIDIFSRVLEADLDAARHLLRSAHSLPGKMIESELRFEHQSGEERWVSVRVCNLLDDPDVNGVVVNVCDVTDRKLVEQELLYQAFHDPLTGLPNRRRFEQDVERSLRNHSDHRTQCAVLFVDIDDFKLVNDSLGHTVGDRVITEVAQRLRRAVGSTDEVARLGGDEFAILIVRGALTATAEVQRIANHILHVLTEPLTVDGRSLRLWASIGIAVGDDGSDTHTLIRDANVAMHRAKTTGKGRWVGYDPSMRESAVEQFEIEVDLVDALERGQFRLAYQPIVDLSNGRLRGIEALIRWRHPVRGDVPPDAFIPLAERNGTILAIGRWVLHEACRVAGEWLNAHPVPDGFYVSVNLSARQITSRGLREDVLDALRASSLPPTSLMLEVTETALVRDEVMASRRLRELRDLGIRLAIDDFGTGYASLSYLRQFEVDVVKIDRSFVDTITQDVRTIPPILSGMVELASHLRLPTIAEGVEREDQRLALLAAGCTRGQGYLFARPLELDDASVFIARHSLVAEW